MRIEISYYQSFKPYYRWITFNTVFFGLNRVEAEVLNLIIDGLPSIQLFEWEAFFVYWYVLNLIIDGLPSILQSNIARTLRNAKEVLNLIIDGLPSIR